MALPPRSIEDFRSDVAKIEQHRDYRRVAAFGIGMATVRSDTAAPETAPRANAPEPAETANDQVMLDARFAALSCGENYAAAAMIAQTLGSRFTTRTEMIDLDTINSLLTAFSPFVEDTEAELAAGQPIGQCRHRTVAALMRIRQQLLTRQAPIVEGQRLAPVVVFIADFDDPPSSTADVFLRLTMMSARLVEPHQLNLDGIFDRLKTVAWTSRGPIDPSLVERLQFDASLSGSPLQIYGLDKFPPMTNYVIPEGVRIADTTRVRLGAYLSSGTVVMHEGFVNFNAGTLGPAMVEGRISAGVVVGANSDIGGGASIMGTLSGGGRHTISIGESCLLGANAGIGISLGDHCTVAAGLYVTASTPVLVNQFPGWESGTTVKARLLSGRDHMLLIRNDATGRVEVRPNGRGWSGLNHVLH